MTTDFADIVCVEGDGINQVTTHLRNLRTKLQGTAELPDLEQARLHNRAMLLRNEADWLWSWSLKRHEEYLWDRARKLIRAQAEIEMTQRLFSHLIDAIQARETDPAKHENVKELFARLITVVEGWEERL